MLEIQKLTVVKGGKKILNQVSVSFEKNKTYLLTGPNGSGKSTLALSIMGDPASTPISGDIIFESKSILGAPIEQRVAMGLFVSWQHPLSIDGISASQLLNAAQTELAKNRKQKPLTKSEYLAALKKAQEKLKIPDDLVNKSLGSSLSGGERKMLELLQILILNPSCIILDEIDAGLDIERKEILTQTIKEWQEEGKSIIIISHSPSLYKTLKIDQIVTMQNINQNEH